MAYNTKCFDDSLYWNDKIKQKITSTSKLCHYTFRSLLKNNMLHL